MAMENLNLSGWVTLKCSVAMLVCWSATHRGNYHFGQGQNKELWFASTCSSRELALGPLFSLTSLRCNFWVNFAQTPQISLAALLASDMWFHDIDWHMVLGLNSLTILTASLSSPRHDQAVCRPGPAGPKKSRGPWSCWNFLQIELSPGVS